MAKFEKDGYCPLNAFLHYKDRNIFSFRTEEILEDRLGFMVYAPKACYKDGYVIDMFLGGESTLGLEVAVVLKCFVPECIYPTVGKKILIFDVIDLELIPDGAKLFQDNRYMVGVQDDGEIVEMYIYQK